MNFKLTGIPKGKEDAIRCISDIFDDPSPYADCRKVAKKVYDWKNVIKSSIKIYDKLFEKYYSKEPK